MANIFMDKINNKHDVSVKYNYFLKSSTENTPRAKHIANILTYIFRSIVAITVLDERRFIKDEQQKN